MSTTALSFVFIVIPIGIGTYGLMRCNRIRANDVVMALVPLSAGIAIWTAMYACAAGPLFDWNAGKIAPVIASVKGINRLYDDPNTGVMSAWIYGPVPAILFSITALLRRPSDVIIAAVAINALVALAPVVWLHWRMGRAMNADPAQPVPRAKDRAIALVGSVVFVWFCLTHESVRRITFMVTPDGPALGLASASIVMLLHRSSVRNWVVCAAFASLSVWCKQTMLPFVFVAPIHLAVTQNLRATVRYARVFAIVFVVISAALIAGYGPSNMRFHMITLPAAHPWRNESDGRWLVAARALADLIRDAIQPLIALAALIALAGIAQAQLARRAIESGWYLLPVASLMLVPSAIVGYVKVGGFINNFALVEFFLALAATSGAVMLTSSMPATIRATQFLRGALCLAALAYAARIAIVRHELGAMASRIANPYANQQEVAYRFARAHPDIVYFPWNPLSTLLAEGKLHHFEWGFVDRREARLIPTEQQIRAHVPSRLLAVAVPSDAQSENALQMFPGARPSRHIPELPGFDMFDVRPPTSQKTNR